MILLVEDNPADVFLFREALGEVAPDVSLSVARDGEQALRLLTGSDRLVPAPDLVALDLNLPRLSGLDVLDELSNHGLADLNVLIFTSSDDPRDVERAQHPIVNGFLKKPSDYTGLLDIMRRILTLLRRGGRPSDRSGPDDSLE